MLPCPEVCILDCFAFLEESDPVLKVREEQKEATSYKFNDIYVIPFTCVVERNVALSIFTTNITILALLLQKYSYDSVANRTQWNISRICKLDEELTNLQNDPSLHQFPVE